MAKYRAKIVVVSLLSLLFPLPFVTTVQGQQPPPKADAPREQAAKPMPPNTFVKVATERADAIYHVGEKVIFNIVVKASGQASTEEVTYALSVDGVSAGGRSASGGGDMGKGKLTLKDGKASVTGSLDKPGILRCTVSPTRDAKELGSGMAAAACDWEKIEPTATMPADFDEFWKAQKAELSKIPMDAKIELVKQPDAHIEVFKITLANINNSRVHSYFAKPKGRGPFPAILGVPGAGIHAASPGMATGYATKGFLSMGISVHDIEDGQSEEYYKKLGAGELREYTKQGREDRMTYYFRRVFLGCVRSVDYLTSRREWDRRHMIVTGGSQGGALALVTGGLDPRITAVATNVPGMCDHSGRNFGRPSGWPQLVPIGPDGKLDPKVLSVSGYYDAVNFARKIKVPTVMGVGLIDNTCPCTTCFAAYSVLAGPKQMDIAPLMGHGTSPSYIALSSAWILKQAGLKK